MGQVHQIQFCADGIDLLRIKINKKRKLK